MPETFPGSSRNLQEANRCVRIQYQAQPQIVAVDRVVRVDFFDEATKVGAVLPGLP